MAIEMKKILFNYLISLTTLLLITYHFLKELFVFPLLIPLIIKFRKSDHKPLFKAQCYNTVEDYTQKEPISIGIVAFLFKCEWLNQEKIC